MRRFATTETVRLDLSDGEWIEVKAELSYGDLQGVASQTRGDFTSSALNLVAAYLLDWSFRDAQDKPVVIETDGAKLAALKALTQEAFREIDEAITTHVEARDASKKAEGRSGKRKSARISASAA